MFTFPTPSKDLHQIWVFVAEESQSLDVADRLVDAIDDTAMLYAANPQIGMLRPELATGIRCFTVGRYVIFYLEATDGIEVVQIVHGSRDIPVHFRKPDR